MGVASHGRRGGDGRHGASAATAWWGCGRGLELIVGGPGSREAVQPGANLCRRGSYAPVHVEASEAAIIAGGGPVRGGGGWLAGCQCRLKPDGNPELGLFDGDLNLLSSLHRKVGQKLGACRGQGSKMGRPKILRRPLLFSGDVTTATRCKQNFGDWWGGSKINN